MKYKAVLSYDGTNYFGYAKQPNKTTIQSEIEKNLSLINNGRVQIYASGRTDKGVHALAQVIDFELNKDIEPFSLKERMNKLLPNDIRIIKLDVAKKSFSSRFSAKKKTYIYIINTAEPTPFLRNYEFYENRIDIELIKECLPLFIGKHNFMNFTSKDSDLDNFYREIIDFKIKTKQGKYIFEITGNGFMKYMVRKIVGVLIEIGKRKLDKTFITNNLEAKTREIVTYTAPPQALYLKKVYY